MRVLFYMLFQLTFMVAFAQWDSDSFIVLKSGDTLNGLVRFKEGEKVSFKLNVNSRTVKYKSQDVVLFEAKGVYYYSIEYTDLNSNTMYSSAFMELREDGPIKLFKHKVKSMNSSTTSNFAYSTAHYDYHIIVGDRKDAISLSGRNLEDILFSHINDNVDLISKIKNKEYKRKDIEIIIKEYNAWKSGKKNTEM